jgi:LysM repeat protein
MFLVSCLVTAQKDYKTHTVQKKETLSQIAETYGVSEASIKALNPTIKRRLKPNTVLVIPNPKVFVSTGDPLSFLEHKVRRKETLFGISQKYSVSIENLKRFNKELYSRQLKRGEKLQIPEYSQTKEIPIVTPIVTPPVSINPKPVSADLSSLTSHTVQPKETRYGIARMYGITVAQLEQINPQFDDGLSVGSVINVPAVTVMETAVPEVGFMFYAVQPKEGFYRLKIKTGLTEEEIVALNPYAKDGLKEGMVLKIPTSASGALVGNANKRNLENAIVNTSKKRVAVLLPFRLNKVTSDSLQVKREEIKKNRLMSLSLDFYSGVLMATEFAKDKGISIQLDVYDTEYSSSKVSAIINSNDFDDFDAVIGPLGQKNVQKAAAMLKNNKVPVFSPLSNKEIKISKNVFQTLPGDEMLEKGMLDFISSRIAGKNVIVIADKKKTAQRAKIMAAIPDAKTASPREEGFLYVKDIEDQIDINKENWVILESEDPIIVSNVVGVLNGLPVGYRIRLFSLDKNEAYDYNDVSNVNLAKLNFTFPSVNKSYNYKDENAFLISYKNKYGVLPNRFAVRGFDLTYDVLLRLASADDIYEASDEDFETEYIENKFRYSKKFLSGYKNNAFYIIKYKDDLQFEVIE